MNLGFFVLWFLSWFSDWILKRTDLISIPTSDAGYISHVSRFFQSMSSKNMEMQKAKSFKRRITQQASSDSNKKIVDNENRVFYIKNKEIDSAIKEGKPEEGTCLFAIINFLF